MSFGIFQFDCCSAYSIVDSLGFGIYTFLYYYPWCLSSSPPVWHNSYVFLLSSVVISITPYLSLVLCIASINIPYLYISFAKCLFFRSLFFPLTIKVPTCNVGKIYLRGLSFLLGHILLMLANVDYIFFIIQRGVTQMPALLTPQRLPKQTQFEPTSSSKLKRSEQSCKNAWPICTRNVKVPTGIGPVETQPKTHTVTRMNNVARHLSERNNGTNLNETTSQN